MPKIAALLLACAAGAAPQPAHFELTPAMQTVLKQIGPNSLRGNLSFLASDLLAGRDTPSQGLDIAAEYIAAQFRRSGIEAAGGDGYFQTIKLTRLEPDLNGFALRFSAGSAQAEASQDEVAVRAAAALELDQAPLFKLDVSSAALIENLTPEQLNGKAVITELVRGAMQRSRSAMSKLREAKPAVVILIERRGSTALGRSTGQLIDPEEAARQTPRVTVASAAVARFYDGLKPGLAGATLTLHVAAPKQHPVTVRNVAAILRGSDPALKDTAVMLTAHYDHIGEKSGGEGDRIFNGANDDGSGTVSLLEIANALQSLKERPRRSIVFVAFCGEEKGGLGSRYYARHPAIPLAKTIADINLEQVGRTDSTEGEQKDNASLTGFDYSNLAETLQAAGEATGIKIYRHPRNSDIYFGASDNISLAEQGVPAHSLSVAFDYADYHGVGDEWQKIDYDNMARVDRMAAAALLMLANSSQTPRWNAGNPKAAPYFNAWKKTHRE